MTASRDGETGDLFLWIGVVLLNLQAFVLFDWDRGAARVALLLTLGALVWLCRAWAPRFAKITPTRAITRVAQALLLLAVLVDVGRWAGAMHEVAQSHAVTSDQATTVIEGLRVLEQRTNPYAADTVTDKVAYDLANDALAAQPECRLTTAATAFRVGKADETVVPRVADTSDCRPLARLYSSLGFKYGPVLLFFYLPFVWLLGPAGFLFAHLLVVASFGLVLYRRARGATGSPFWAAMVLLPPAWATSLASEVLVKEHLDIVPVVLCALAWIATQRRRFGLAAACIGVSLAAKFLPALLFLPLLLGGPRRFWVAPLAIAAACFAPFAAWDWTGLWHNVGYPFTRPPDSTSLAFFLPAAARTGLRVAALLVAIAFAARAQRAGWIARSSLEYLLFSTLAVLASGTAFHNNYVVWLLPLFSLYLAEAVLSPPVVAEADPGSPASSAGVVYRVVKRARAALERVAAAVGLPAGCVVCAPLAVIAIWAQRYPPGDELPQHAEILRLWLDLGKGLPEVDRLYELRPFTSSVVAYALAYPAAKWFGPLAGVKLVLTLAAVATPWAMARWLRAVGGDPELAVLGFVAALGWPFLVGILPICVALPVLFLYLASFEEQGEAPTVVRGVETAFWGTVLACTDATTFWLAVVCAVARLLCRRRPDLAWRAWIQFAPATLIAARWMRTEGVPRLPRSGWFVDPKRAVELLSGPFSSTPDPTLAKLSVGLVFVALAFARPGLSRRLAAWIPVAVVVAAFVLAPRVFSGDPLFGARFCAYVPAVAPAILLAAPGRYGRRLHAATLALAAGFIVLLGARIYLFNHSEMAPFDEIAAQADPAAGIETLMAVSDEGAGFGRRGLAMVGGWVTAERGGLIRQHFETRHDLPIHRTRVPLPRRFRYVFTHGESGLVARVFPDAELRAQAGRWSLYERPVQATGGVVVLRSGQRSGDLAVDTAVDEGPLVVAGATFEHGLGTNADSWIDVQLPPDAPTLEGRCGVDDGADPETRVVFVVRGPKGATLFRSEAMTKGEPARAFSVPRPAGGTLSLEATTTLATTTSSVDWVDLRAGGLKGESYEE